MFGEVCRIFTLEGTGEKLNKNNDTPETKLKEQAKEKK